MQFFANAATMQAFAQLVEALASVLMLATLFFGLRQLKIMADEYRAHNLLALLNLLFSPNHRAALTQVRQGLRGKSIDTWTNEEKIAAGTVVSCYNLAGLMVEEKLVDRKIILDNWGSSIKDCHEITAPFLEMRRKENGSDYLRKFTELYIEAKQRRESLGTQRTERQI